MRLLVLPIALFLSLPLEAKKRFYEEPLAYLTYPLKEQTPGDILDHITEDDVCTEGYARHARNVSTKMKRKIKENYGIPPEHFKYYSIDHFFPLSLGGSNDPSNLWPQAINHKLGASQKALSDAYLHKQVCKGEMSLEYAQKRILKDWVKVFEKCCG